jgi:hypothetical protein
MINKIKLLTATAVLSLLSACGGGGGGEAVPVASTSTFNLQAAYKSYYATSASYKFNITGTYGANPISGSGSAVVGTVSSGTFEGQSALQQTTTITGSFIANNQTIPLAASSISWLDTNYMPRGVSGGSEYIVVDSSGILPIAAKINDTGSFFTAKRYTTSAKTTLLGTRTVTYVVEADSGTTALVTLIYVDKNNAGTMTSTATSQYRITTANTFTKIKETLVDNVTGISLILTIVN